MWKNLITYLFILLLVSCDSQNDEVLNQTGIVSERTSCSGGVEPIYVIKLTGKDSIMTGTLPKEFQKSDLKIQFKTKAPNLFLFCTSDKIYPEIFDVFDVSLLKE